MTIFSRSENDDYGIVHSSLRTPDDSDCMVLDLRVNHRLKRGSRDECEEYLARLRKLNAENNRARYSLYR